MTPISNTTAPSNVGYLLDIFWGGIFFFKKRSQPNNIERQPHDREKTSFFLTEFVLIPELKVPNVNLRTVDQNSWKLEEIFQVFPIWTVKP